MSAYHLLASVVGSTVFIDLCRFVPSLSELSYGIALSILDVDPPRLYFCDAAAPAVVVAMFKIAV